MPDLVALRPILQRLLDEGADSAFVVDDRGEILAFAGLAPKTQIIWLPPTERLARGPASALSATGERLAFVRFGPGVLLASVFPGATLQGDAEVAMRDVTRPLARLH